jgi:hypothetical protein
MELEHELDEKETLLQEINDEKNLLLKELAK